MRPGAPPKSRRYVFTGPGEVSSLVTGLPGTPVTPSDKIFKHIYMYKQRPRSFTSVQTFHVRHSILECLDLFTLGRCYLTSKQLVPGFLVEMYRSRLQLLRWEGQISVAMSFVDIAQCWFQDVALPLSNLHGRSVHSPALYIPADCTLSVYLLGRHGRRDLGHAESVRLAGILPCRRPVSLEANVDFPMAGAPMQGSISCAHPFQQSAQTWPGTAGSHLFVSFGRVFLRDFSRYSSVGWHCIVPCQHNRHSWLDAGYPSASGFVDVWRRLAFLR